MDFMRNLALVLLMLPLSMAAVASMSGSIDAGGTANLILAESFSGAAGHEVLLNITGPAQVVVKDRSGLVLPPRIIQGGGYTLVYVTVPVDYLEYDITSDSFTGKSGDSWAFDLVLGTSVNVSSFNSTISLPPGAVVKMTNGAVSTGNDQLSIIWSGTNLDPSRRVHLKASYDVVPLPAQPDPLLYAAAVAAFLVLAFLMLRFRPKKETLSEKPLIESIRTPPVEENSVFRTLDETDKEIIREMLAQGGKTTQARIYMQTHIPKATLSRRLASLESRGIIQKSQKGNRNLVSLTDVVK